jgi:isoleucyl-tRNA synthetase
MDSYKLYNVVKPLIGFLEDLTNWYVRLNRPRMKGDDNDEED